MAIMAPFLLQWCHLPSEITRLEYAGLLLQESLVYVLIAQAHVVLLGPVSYKV